MFKFITYRFKFSASGFMNSEINGFIDIDISANKNHLNKAKEKAKNILIERGLISEGQKVLFQIIGKSEKSF